MRCLAAQSCAESCVHITLSSAPRNDRPLLVRATKGAARGLLLTSFHSHHFTTLQPLLVCSTDRGGWDGAGCGGSGGGGGDGDGDGGHEHGADGDSGRQRGMRLLALIASAALQQAGSAGAALAKR